MGGSFLLKSNTKNSKKKRLKNEKIEYMLPMFVMIAKKSAAK